LKSSEFIGTVLDAAAMRLQARAVVRTRGKPLADPLDHDGSRN
jgi:hypothetical protein